MANVYGTAASETLAGGAAADSIYGGGGADTIFGGGGGDRIEALSDGNVIYGDLYATDPADRGDGGNDTILAGIGNEVHAGSGNDYITSLGSSTLDGGSGNDTIIGNDPNSGAGGTNLVIGGSGNDLIRATGVIWTDDADDATAREGGDIVVISYRDRIASGQYTVQDFKTGVGGDVLALSNLFNDLSANGFDGLNPLIDQLAFEADGTRVVQATADTLGGNSWLRLRQVGADVHLEVDATGAANGSDYLTVVVLKNTTLASLSSTNFDPPFSLDGSVVNASIAGGTGNDLIYALDGADTITGGAGNDTIRSTYGNDSVDGGAGGDEIRGGAGNDTLVGNGGAFDGQLDRLYGDAGNDVLMAGAGGGPLQAEGGDGFDAITGGSADDTLSGGGERDTLLGGSGNDYLYGGADWDTLDGGTGRDYLSGDAGDDRLYSGVSNVVFGAQRQDVTYTVNGSDTIGDYLAGGDDSDTLIGGAGADTLDGGAGQLTAFGNAGNDTIVAAGTGHWVDGGAGNDSIDVGGSSTVQGGEGEDYIAIRLQGNVVDTGAGSDTVYLRYGADWGSNNALSGFTPGAGGDQLDLTDIFPFLAQSAGFDYSNPFTTGWLRLTASGANTLLQIDLTGNANGGQWLTVLTVNNTAPGAFTDDNFVYNIAPAGDTTPRTLNGDTLDNRIEGWDGGDTISGNAGNDRLDGGFGGADSLVGGEGSDSLFGFSGNDTLNGDGGNDFAFGGSGDDVINGGLGDDSSAYGGIYKGTYYGYGLAGGTGNDTIDGGDGNDVLYGEAGNDSLLGGAGNDTLDGGEGTDVLRGGAGVDNLSGSYGAGGDSLYGDAGNDYINLQQSQGGLADGGADDDSINFNGTAVTVLGGSGNDTMGTPFYTATSGSLIDGGEGNDSISGVAYGGASYEFSNNTVIGGLGDDLLVLGGSGNTIDLGAGNDTLDFEYYSYGTGTGTVTTGTGVDVIELSLRGLEQGRAAAVITDFTTGAGGDRIDLTNVLGRLAENGYDYSNPFTSGWARLVQSGADTLLQIDSDGAAGAGGWVTLATLQSTTALAFTSANFIDDISPTGFALGLDKTGTEAADTVTGSDGSDTLQGLGGDDVIDGAFGGNDLGSGGDGNDRLFGFSGNDTLDAGLGNDFVHGGSGNDVINGGAGDDNAYGGIYKGTYYGYGLSGGTGNDTIDGGDGNDQLYGEAGADSLLGGAGNDTLDGGEGTDVLRGGDGADNLSSSYSAGGDSLYGDAGNDYINLQQSQGGLADGGADDDSIGFSGTAVTVLGGSGNDTMGTPFYTSTSGSLIDGGEGNDSISGVAYGGASYEFSNNTVIGGLGDDLLVLGGSGNTIDLGAGNDTLDFEYYSYGTGTGTVTTGTGVDVIELSLRGLEQGRAAAVITDFTTGAGGDRIDLTNVLGRLAENGYDYSNPFTSGWARLVQSGADTLLQVDQNGSTGGGNWLTLATLQNTLATAFVSDNFAPQSLAPAGNLAPVTLTGGLAPDTLVGWDGGDVIAGNGDNDVLDGGFGGADSLAGGEGSDSLYGFSGNDTLDGGLDNDFVFGGSGDDVINGGAGDDNAYGGIYKGTYYGYGLSGGTGNDTMDGGDGNDQVYGDAGNDSLLGGAGNDTLDGGNGADVLRGGDGADNLSGGNQPAADSIHGDAGNDNLTLSSSPGGLADGGADNDTITFSGTAVTVLGGSGNDAISTQYYTRTTGSLIDGGDGNDSITGFAFGGASYEFTDNTVIGGLGDDLVALGGSRNTIDLGEGNDTIDFEYISYGSGTVSTGTGLDVIQPSLRGLEGGLGPVVVTDFTAGVGGDRIDLTDVISRLEQSGLAVGSDPFAEGYLRLTDNGTSTVLEADIDGATGGANFQTLVLLQGIASPASITAANFVQAVTPVVSANARAPIAQSKTVTLAEDASATALGITAPTDPDGGAVTILLTAVPQFGAIRLADNTQVYGGQTLTSAQLTQLTFTPYANYNGDLGSLRFSVLDNEGSSVMGEIRLQATPVNDAPYINASQFGYSDDGLTRTDIDLDSYAYDIDGDALTFTVSMQGGAPLPAWLNYDPVTHVLSGIAPRNGGATLVLEVSAQDPSGLSTGVQTITMLPSAVYRYGTEAGDILEGLSGNDNLNGAGGNDTLVGNAGADTMYGGEGDDVYIVDNTGDYLYEAPGAGIDRVESSVTRTLGADFENLTLTGPAAIDGTGNALANVLVGNGAANRLEGLEGDDTLDGGAGGDTLAGGLGNDRYVIDDGADQALELAGEGTDNVQALISHTLGAEIENLTLIGVAAIDGTGNALANVITGNGAANKLIGGAGTDTLIGGAGDDVYVLDGADLVVEIAGEGIDEVQSGVSTTIIANVENLRMTGSAGIKGTGNGLANTFFVNAGNNAINGAGGLDTVSYAQAGSAVTASLAIAGAQATGGSGSDSFAAVENLTGSNFNDTLTGSSGNNALDGGAGNDALDGGAGNDTLTGGSGVDTLTGGAGNDAYTADAADTIVELADGGIDEIQSGASFSGLAAGVENIRLTGTANIDATGNAGDNVLISNAGNNTLDGGDGLDTASYAQAASAVTVSLALVGAQATGSAGSDTLVRIENLLGSAYDDTLTGSAGANRLDGGAGNDSINGGDGNDVLVGNVGNDTLRGGLGDDVYALQGADVILEDAGGGIDEVQTSGSYGIAANVENVRLQGTGNANVAGNGLANVIHANVGNNALNGAGGVDTASYTFAGSAVTVSLDVLVAQATGGSGSDTLTNFENLTGSAYDDVLGGNGGNNVLDGLGGNDTLSGGAGNDTLIGGGGNDSLAGGTGNDVYVLQGADVIVENAGEGTDEVQTSGNSGLGANLENLRLLGTGNINGSGNSADNVITGNTGNNSLNGSGGNDTLTGGAGADTLIGGAGNDTMVLNSLVGSDTITDFVTGVDRLLISQGGIAVGDGDTLVEGAVTRAAPGGFAASAELVVVTGNIAGTITTASAAAAIGSATGAYAVGQTALFMVDNGSSSALYLFTAGNADALISAGELTLLADLTGTPSTTTGDILFGG